MSFRNRKNNADFAVTTSQRDGSRSFRGDHDDRFYNASNNQRGRGYRGGGRNRNKRGGFKNFNAHSSRYRNNRYGGDDDGDEAMGDDNRRNRGSSRGRFQRGSGRGMRRSGSGRLSDGQGRFDPEKQWYKVSVPFGARLGQAELFKLIQDNTDVQVPFQNYHTIDQRAYFYVQGASISEGLRTLSRRISRPDGQKLTLIVNESGPPKFTNVSDEQKEKLKVTMSGRYELSTHFLNMSYFHNDESLNRESLPLNKFNVMEAVIKIIAENIPEMTGVDFTGNSIASLSSLTGLVKAAPGVTSLNLSKNQIRSLDELEKLKGWRNIVELVLDGNELCNSHTSETAYVRWYRDWVLCRMV